MHGGIWGSAMYVELAIILFKNSHFLFPLKIKITFILPNLCAQLPTLLTVAFSLARFQKLKYEMGISNPKIPLQLLISW